MLTDLRIRNLALIDELDLTFEPGLNVLTGETGAGKSIIVGGLGLVSGERADSRMVRDGARAAFVEATFERITTEAGEMVGALGGVVEDGCVILRREVTSAGKSRAFLGGSAVPVASLREVAGRLVDLHRQHQSRSLLRPDAHTDALDRFGRLGAQRERVARDCERARTSIARVAELEEALGDRQSRIDFLAFQERELAAAAPEPGEEASLEAESRRLSHAVRIAELAGRLQLLLAEQDGSALDLLGQAAAAIEELSRLDPAMQANTGRLDEARFALEDVAAAARTCGSIEADPDRVEAIESRLALLETLGRKHGGDAAHLARRLVEIRGEIDRLDAGDESLETLRKEALAAVETYRRSSAHLGRMRSEAAVKLKKAMEGELSDLAFNRVRFEVSLVARQGGAGSVDVGGRSVTLSVRGAEEVEFLFSPNLGEDPRPLGLIASGGELSRVMLALNVVLGNSELPPTVVFDEVDAGIGGRTAGVVGERLDRLAADRQVLCVTHLPQVACRGGAHWHVSKRERGGKTLVTTERLDRQGRVDEIGRMLAGRELTEAARRNARELLDRAAATGGRGRTGGTGSRRPASSGDWRRA